MESLLRLRVAVRRSRRRAPACSPTKPRSASGCARIARFYGNLIGVKYGEPFVVKETMRVDDLVQMPVRSI